MRTDAKEHCTDKIIVCCLNNKSIRLMKTRVHLVAFHEKALSHILEVILSLSPNSEF